MSDWQGDTWTAPDRRQFSLSSEQVRGERRYFSPRQWDAERRLWLAVPDVDGHHDRRVAQRRVERYARETAGK